MQIDNSPRRRDKRPTRAVLGLAGTFLPAYIFTAHSGTGGMVLHYRWQIVPDIKTIITTGLAYY